MQARLSDIPQDLAGSLAEALAKAAVSVAPPESRVALLVIGSADPARALSCIAEHAADRPAPARAGGDLVASGAVIWLMPGGAAGGLAGALRQAALTHAPRLRVNAIHLGPRRPPPAPWQAAWGAAQPHPGPKPLPQALAEALGFLLQTPSLTGQLVNLGVPL